MKFIGSSRGMIASQVLILVILLTVGTPSCAEAVSGAPAAVIDPNPKGNVINQVAGGVKEWFVSYGDAFNQMRADHERCNAIRQKQNRFKATLKEEWEDLGVEPKEVRTRLNKVSGGISFDEFLFLRKGKGDREKLISLVFYASFLPKMMPYMLMFNAGNMLPDQFPKKQSFFGETKREALSRERSHAVLKTLMTLERGSHVQGFMINPFGGAKKRQQMQDLGNLSLQIEEGIARNAGPDYVMASLEDRMFLAEKPKAKELNLANFPAVLTRGLANCFSGNSNRALEGLIPNFIDRQSVLSHLKSVSQSDEFLVNQAVDMNSLKGASLVEACSDRLISTLGTSEAEMREKLNTWLRCAAIIPSRRTRKTGEHYNGNLARSSLMCYYAMDSLRHKQSAAALPRLLIQSDSSKATSSSNK